MGYLIHWLLDAPINRHAPQEIELEISPFDGDLKMQLTKLDTGPAASGKAYCRELWAACTNGGDVQHVLAQLAARRPWLEGRRPIGSLRGEHAYYDEAVTVLITLDSEKRPAVYHMQDGRFVKVIAAVHD